MHDFVQAKTLELGIPDWREPTAYPDPDDLRMSDWHWEFLRRNPKYREAYDLSELSLENESKALYFERVYLLSGPVDPRLSVKQYLKLTEGKLFCSNHFDNFIGSGSLSSMHAQAYEIERIMHNRSFHDLFFRIDPLKPLDPQFRGAIEIATRSQVSLLGHILAPRTRKDKWPLYLRVLDARDCKATYSEIARVCLRHQEQGDGAARDLAKQARKLRDVWPVLELPPIERR